MTLLECIYTLIDEAADDGVLGKLKKYAGDIGAGAVAHTVGAADGHVGAGATLLAHKAYDIGSKNYQEKNKSLSGSLVGNALGAGLSHLAHQHIKVG